MWNIDFCLSISLLELCGIVELTVLSQSVKQDTALVLSLHALQLYIVHDTFSLFILRKTEYVMSSAPKSWYKTIGGGAICSEQQQQFRDVFYCKCLSVNN